jgi:outer membrane protein assembly factor BamB
VTLTSHRTVPVLLALLVSAAVLDARQWAQWRGPNRDGVVPASLVPPSWPEKPTLQWKQDVGEGYASPVVAGDRVYVHSRKDLEEILSAFDLATGTPIWSQRYAAPFTKNRYATAMAKGPNSTPIVSGGRVFTLGSSAVLSSFDAASGALKWRKDWSKEIDTSKLFTGTSMSPIIDGNLLIVHVGDDRSGAVRAIDPISGTETWSVPGHGPGYASPIVTTISGTRQLVTMTDKAVIGIDVASGTLLWQIAFPDEWNENIVTPTFAGDVLVVSGTRKGTFGYRLDKSDKSGAARTPRQVWHNTDLPMYMSSPVADGPFIYGLSSKRKGQIFCLDARTGTAKWATEGRAAENASLLSVGPNLVALTSEGELIVATRNPEKFEELHRYKVADSQTYAHPVVLSRGVVIRDASAIALWSLVR